MFDSQNENKRLFDSEKTLSDKKPLGIGYKNHVEEQDPKNSIPTAQNQFDSQSLR